MGRRRVLPSAPAPSSGVSVFCRVAPDIQESALLLPPFLILNLVAFGFIVVFISSLPVDIERSCDISMAHQVVLSFQRSASIHRKIKS